MPLPFDLLGLITQTTPVAAGRVNPMVFERMQLEQQKKNDAFDQERQRFYMDQSQDDRDYNRDSEAWDKIREAVMSGEPELMAMAQAEAARRGFALDYGAMAKPRQSELKPGDNEQVVQGDGFEFTYPKEEQWVPVGGDDEGNEVSRGTPGSYDEAMAGAKNLRVGNATTWIERALGLAPAGSAASSERAAEDQFLRDAEATPGVPTSPEKDLPLPGMAQEIGGAMGLPPEAPKQSAGGFTVRDRTGKVIFQADQGKIVSARQERVGQVFDQYIAQAGDDEEKAAANIAKGVAQKALSAGYSMKEAVALGIQEYNRNVDPLRKAFIGTEVAKARGKYRYGDGSGGGGGGGLGLPSFGKQEGKEFDAAIKLVADTRKSFGLGDTTMRGMNGLSSALSLMDSDEGFSNRLAVAQQIKAAFGAPSEGERNYFMSAAGVAEQLQNVINTLTSGGALSEEFKRQAKNAVRSALLNARRNQQAAAKQAYENALQAGFSPEMATFSAAQLGFSPESWGGKSTKRAEPNSGSGGGQPAAAKGAAPSKPGKAEAEADRLLNKR